MTESKSVTPTYFEARMKLLGITDEINQIGLYRNDPKTSENVITQVPIFSPDPAGIKITLYTLDRYQVRLTPKVDIDEKTGHGRYNEGRWKKDYCIIRLENPIIKPDGYTMKYKLPKGAGTYPFIPPSLVEKFDSRQPVETLYLTEGAFKAFKASMEGIDIVGLSSITHMKDKETGKLHPDILRIIKECRVKKVVWLTDGDALDITQSEITETKDLSIRPKNFFHSVATFKTLLSDCEEIEIWFFHIDTDSIIETNPKKHREDVKGIDDLLISLPTKTKEIVSDLKSFTNGPYFRKFDITHSYNKVRYHFNLHDATAFYNFHVIRRPELKDKEFTFNGTRYQFDEKENACIVKIPMDAKFYFRVGDDYYKNIEIPDQYKESQKTFQYRQKGTIKDDHRSELFKIRF